MLFAGLAHILINYLSLIHHTFRGLLCTQILLEAWGLHPCINVGLLFRVRGHGMTVLGDSAHVVFNRINCRQYVTEFLVLVVWFVIMAGSDRTLHAAHAQARTWT